MANTVDINIVAHDMATGIFQGIGQAMFRLAEQAGAALLGVFKDTIKAAEELQQTESQLNAVLESTKGAAGVSAQAVNDFASAMSKVTGYTDDQIVKGETILLQFTKIGKDVFPEASKAALDFARRTGQDLPQAFAVIGKALGDPEMGIGRLNMAYRMFDKDQLKVIENMAKNGKVAEAQKLILEGLNKAVGGAAQAYGETFAGKLDIFNAALDQLYEKIGLKVLPVLTNLISLLIDSKVIEKIGDFVDRLFQGNIKLEKLASGFVDLTRQFREAVKNIDWAAISDQIAKGINSIDWTKMGMDFHIAAANIFHGLQDALARFNFGEVFGGLGHAFASFTEGAMGGNWDSTMKNWKENMVQLGSIIKNGGILIAAIIMGWVDDITVALRTVVQAFIVNGLMAGAQFASNFLKAVAPVYTVLRTLVQVAIDFATAVLGHASPAVLQLQGDAIRMDKNFMQARQTVNGVIGTLHNLDGMSVDAFIHVHVTGMPGIGGLADFGASPSMGGGANRSIMRAEGTKGWEKVPSGFPNDSYMVGLTSGEAFNVIPSSKQATSSGGGSMSSQPIVINYSPMISTASRREVTDAMVPIVREAMRQLKGQAI